MSILSQHIEYLLRRQDCIILPGIGAFIASRQCATVDTAKGLILPPLRRISFNPAVTADDGLLAHSIGRKYSLPFDEARERLEELISEMRSRLEQSGEVVLGNIGKLQTGEEKTLQFIPAFTAEEQWRQLGLQPLQLLEPRVSRSATSVETAPTSGPKSEPVHTEAALQETLQKERKKENYVHIKISRRLLKVAASVTLLCAVAAGGFFLPVGERRDNGEQMASMIPMWGDEGETSCNNSQDKASPVVEMAAPANSSDDSSSAHIALDNLADSEDGQRPDNTVGEASDSEQQSPSGPSHLIVGAFVTEARAKEYIRQQEEQNGERLTIVEERGKRLVSACDGSYEKVHAQKNDAEFRKKHPDSWILTQEE